jgi:hypothetical protein
LDNGGKIAYLYESHMCYIKTLVAIPHKSQFTMTRTLLDKIALSLLALFVLTLGFTIFEHITHAGDQLYQTQLTGVLAIVVFVTLVVGFFGVKQSPTNRYSSLAVIAILSVWSLGIITLLLLVKSHLIKYATTIAWVLTVISGLAVLSLYGFWVALFTIPVSLFFGYIQLQSAADKSGVVLPIVLNLFLCGVITSFSVSAGLWR